MSNLTNMVETINKLKFLTDVVRPGTSAIHQRLQCRLETGR